MIPAFTDAHQYTYAQRVRYQCPGPCRMFAVRSRSFGRLAYHICSHSKTKEHAVGRFIFWGESSSQVKNYMSVFSFSMCMTRCSTVFHSFHWTLLRNLRMMQDLWMLVRGLLKSGRPLDGKALVKFGGARKTNG